MLVNVNRDYDKLPDLHRLWIMLFILSPWFLGLYLQGSAEILGSSWMAFIFIVRMAWHSHPQKGVPFGTEKR